MANDTANDTVARSVDRTGDCLAHRDPATSPNGARAFASVTPPTAGFGGLEHLRQRIETDYRRDEAGALHSLLDESTWAPGQLAAVQSVATTLAEGVRAARQRAGGVDALMLEFSLDSREGIALMCLAEALLRVPDAATRDRLIRDKVGPGDWRAHVGRSPSLFVNAAAWGLLVTGRLVDTRSDRGLEQALVSLLRKGGEPLVRKGVDLAMRLLGKQFVLGQTIEEALANASERRARGYRFSFDMLGEAALTEADAQHFGAAYETAIHAVGATARGAGVRAGPGMSVKLSALHPRFVRSQRGRVMAELLPRVARLALLAREYDIGFNIDAEEADRLELSLDVLQALVADRSLSGWDGLGFVVQAYQKRARATIDWLGALARHHRRRLMVRLVKGAYWDSEIKRAQVDGMSDYPVFTRKAHTDVSYLACAKALLAATDALYPQFASHHAFTVAAIHVLAGDAEFEFQCLHGMGESIYDLVIGPDRLNRACRIYAPVGAHDTLLAYLVRRLLENGANTSFVNRIVDPAVPIADLVADPIARVQATGGAHHPRIPLPDALYPDRRNSHGLDLSDESVLRALEPRVRAPDPPFAAAPMLAEPGRHAARTALPVVNPADHRDVVGSVENADVTDVAEAVRYATTDRTWSRTSATARADCLERAADLIEEARDTLVTLAAREAGKTLASASGEVREAADFCRYYAAQARRELEGTTPRGPIACIAPWNFPLAIFVGQISAALAAGNTVLAKPAEQTPLTAAVAVGLLHRAGVAPAALQLLPGSGERVGAALTADPRIAGVLFTGSTAVARTIYRTLASRLDDPVLIAETGGQNSMVVDSSALPEQVVTDALTSAFDSAGQRCSALRVLCLQEDIAERVLAMLKGAMRELRVGDPRALDTDVGPVIDRAALANLDEHVARLRSGGAPTFSLPLPAECANGTFFPPTLIELAHPRQLQREVFGPVLHVVRYREGELVQLIDALNAAGYGLTHGIQTRIDETVALVCERIRAGNIYVNRNLIGAVVGVQPFGGEGLSGTGPKAGGPHFLRRLVRGRVAAEPPEIDRGVLLPGPTGETNTLYLRPRGRVACIATTAADLRAQAQLATSLGNIAVLGESADARRIGGELRGTCDVVADPLAAPPDVVLFSGSRDGARALRVALAEKDGALVPVVVGHDGDYDASKLYKERTVTVNTAASGGNASLLSLEEGEPG